MTTRRIRRSPSWAVATAALFAVAGCWDSEAARELGPPLGYENSWQTCTDGRDNDRDRRVNSCSSPKMATASAPNAGAGM